MKNYILVLLLSCFTMYAQGDAEIDTIEQRYDLDELTISGKAKLKSGDKIVLIILILKEVQQPCLQSRNLFCRIF